MYSDALIPDSKFIFKMTGVKIVDYSNLKFKKDEKLSFTCKLKQRKSAVKNRCGVKDKTPCPCEKPMMTIHCSKPKSSCSTIGAQNAKQIIQTQPSINTVSVTNKNTNTVNTESDCKCNNLDMTYQECKSNSKCLKKSVKKPKSDESCKFPMEEDLNINDNNESKERKNCSAVLNTGRSTFNDSSNYDCTVSCVEISLREPDQSCSSTPPPAEKAPNSNAICGTTISLVQGARAEPEDQSARFCSSVQNTQATPLCQSSGTAESVREPPQERRDCKNSERTENGGREDAIFGSGQRRPSLGPRMSAPEPRDRCASAPRGPTSDDRRRVEQRPAKDQNRSCPVALMELRPPTPRRPDISAVSYSDRSASQQQQQQHESVGPSNANRSDTAALIAATADWDPEVSSYSAFSGRHMAEDRSRFLTSERTIDDLRPAAMRSRPSSPLPQLLPANDFHSAAAAAAANNDNDLSDGSFGASSDWSDELGFDRCQSCVAQSNASSLSTLTSSDSSIEMRIAARQPLGRNVNYARRRHNLSMSNNDRYPFDDSLTPNLSDVSLQRGDRAVADVWPPACDLVEDVSMPGSLVTGPWSLSMSGSRSGRGQEFGDAGASDQYDTSCSEDGSVSNESGRDDYGGAETDDDGGDAAPQPSRNY